MLAQHVPVRKIGQQIMTTQVILTLNTELQCTASRKKTKHRFSATINSPVEVCEILFITTHFPVAGLVRGQAQFIRILIVFVLVTNTSPSITN
jgi:hypothetical protein